MNKSFFDSAAACLPDVCFKEPPRLGLVLGSGWDVSIDPDEVVARIDYADIPGLGATGVKGHAGELVVFRRYGKLLVAWRGRRHYYEGEGWEPVVLPIEILRRMGCEALLLTNASGGINPALRPGDFVVLNDHINSVVANPLIGAHFPEWGERFPDMINVYSMRMNELLRAGAHRIGLRMMNGVYVYTAGPCYETPAEINAYRAQGADVVGMSTVPEAIFAHACGIAVSCVSFVSNLAAGIGGKKPCHEEVLAAGAAAKPQMAALIDDFISRMC